MHTDKNTAKEVITGKLYEYIASRTPIIFISAGETEGGKVIKKNKLGYSINYLENNLEHFFLNLKKNSNLKQKTNIQIFSRKFQNKKLFLLLK